MTWTGQSNTVILQQLMIRKQIMDLLLIIQVGNFSLYHWLDLTWEIIFISLTWLDLTWEIIFISLTWLDLRNNFYILDLTWLDLETCFQIVWLDLTWLGELCDWLDLTWLVTWKTPELPSTGLLIWERLLLRGVYYNSSSEHKGSLL
jgi:hypothetical protein